MRIEASIEKLYLLIPKTESILGLQMYQLKFAFKYH